jgi:hypothetical protein
VAVATSERKAQAYPEGFRSITVDGRSVTPYHGGMAASDPVSKLKRAITAEVDLHLYKIRGSGVYTPEEKEQRTEKVLELSFVAVESDGNVEDGVTETLDAYRDVLQH